MRVQGASGSEISFERLSFSTNSSYGAPKTYSSMNVWRVLGIGIRIALYFACWRRLATFMNDLLSFGTAKTETPFMKPSQSRDAVTHLKLVL